MPTSLPPGLSARHDQMFPTLAREDIDRLRRFGEPRSYAAGEPVVRAGEVGPGLILVLSGKLEVIQGAGSADRRRSSRTVRDNSWANSRSFPPGPRWWMPRRSSRSRRSSSRPSRLRDLMVQEADLGERIMRALILRRVGLLESGAAGPIIIGQAGILTCCGCRGFLAKRPAAPRPRFRERFLRTTLIERFHVDFTSCRSCCVPNGQIAAQS